MFSEINHYNILLISINTLLIIYASMNRPPCPDIVRDIFNNTIFRILVMTLIAYLGSQDITLSLMVTLGFIVILAALNKLEAKEAFEQLEEFIGYEEFKANIR